ncbi:MAG: MFS transporter [Actinomycetaceae bacterium]|nr:MFS transporter [Actinomycetaceae bacterium]
MNWRLTIGAMAVITLIAFEQMATTTAMPAVVEDLGGLALFPISAGIGLAAQVFTITIAGGWCDKKGPAPVLFTGLILFASGLLMCAFAPTMIVFVIGRAIQGLGAGLVVVPVYVMAGYLVPGNKLPAFFAMLSFAWVTPSLLGPAVAGLIIRALSWHWVFGIAAPLALLTSLPLFSVVKQVPKGDPDKLSLARGAIVSAAITGFALALLQGVSSMELIPMLIVTLTCFGVLLKVLPSILPEGALRARRGLSAVVMVRLTAMGALGVGTAFLPLILVRYHGWDELQAGVALSFTSVTWACASFTQSRVVRIERRMKLPILGGFLILTGCLGSLTLASLTLHPALGVGLWSIAGFGAGLVAAPSSVLALEVSDPSVHGTVSAYLQNADAVGPSLAMGLVSVLFASTAQLSTPISFAPAPIIIAIMALVAIFMAKRIPTRSMQ